MAARSRARAVVFMATASLLAACLRAPLGDDPLYDSDADVATTDDAAGLSITGPSEPEDDAGTTTDATDPDCHPSYIPCLPVVDDLNCDEVRAMGAAPVQVVGEDDYRLDADKDGIGCE